MKKICRKMSLIVFASFLLYGCANKNKTTPKNVPSSTIAQTLQQTNESAAYAELLILDNNNLELTDSKNSFDDSSAYYYVSEPIRKHFEENYNVTIEDEVAYGVESQYENDNDRLNGLFSLLEEAGNITLSQEERDQLVSDKLNDYKTQMKNESLERAKASLDMYNVDVNELNSMVFYTSPNIVRANTFVVFDVKDKNMVEKYKKIADDIYSSVSASFENYLPEQYDLVKQSEVQVMDNVVMLVIAEDAMSAVNAIKALYK